MHACCIARILSFKNEIGFRNSRRKKKRRRKRLNGWPRSSASQRNADKSQKRPGNAKRKNVESRKS
jgi:hypothetical protein